MCTSTEHRHAHHNGSNSEQGRDHPEDRECQEERDRDQHRSYTDQDSGHESAVRRIFGLPLTLHYLSRVTHITGSWVVISPS
jgi:hypothetical protein